MTVMEGGRVSVGGCGWACGGGCVGCDCDWGGGETVVGERVSSGMMLTLLSWERSSTNRETLSGVPCVMDVSLSSSEYWSLENSSEELDIFLSLFSFFSR